MVIADIILASCFTMASTAIGIAEDVALPLQQAPSLVTDGYVDDARCARCHEEIAATYAHLGMGRSFCVPGPDHAVADFSVEGGHFHHEASNLHYRMWLDEQGRMWMRQHELDEDGGEINAIDVEAHFAVGSANHARTYLHRSPSGELWELPVSWYTEGGWNMSPGFDHANHQGFGRQVNRECIFCHNAYPDVPVGSDVLGRTEAFPEVLPSGIGCQRCHGPGARHVELAYSAEATDDEILDSILNPEDLPPALADDVCLQCHMQPTSRLGSLVRPFNRGDFSYRPGEPLEDYLVHLDYEVPADHPTFEVNHHGYRLRASPCWQGPGSPGCLDCHDPHERLSPVAMEERTRASCLSCHEPVECNVEQVMQVPRAEAQDCARCHMPTRHSNDAIHVQVTDHLIQVPPADSELLAPASDIPPPATFSARVLEPGRHPDPSLARRHEILGEILGRKTDNLDELQANLDNDENQDGSLTTRIVLAQGLMQDGRDDEARAVLEAIIAEDPGSSMALKNLAMLEFKAGERDLAMQRLRELVEQDPADAAAVEGLALALKETGQTGEAIDVMEQATKLRPLDQDAYEQLGALLASQGRYREAASALQRAEALAPGNSSTGFNLGLALWKAGKRAEAARAWNQALQRSPGSPRLLQAAALTWSLPWSGLPNDPERGVAFAGQLLDQQPDSPDAWIVMAAVLLAAGDERTAAVLDQAAQREADLASVRLVQAMLLASMGRKAEGEEIYRRAAPRITQKDMLREGLLNRAAIVFDGK